MNSKFIQLIFVVETTKKAKTDYYYIKEILGKYYTIGNNKTSYVYMCGKHNYDKLSVTTEIIKLIREYKVTGGETIVVYVCDKDKNMSVPQDFEFIRNLEIYCSSNNYKLTWFVTTVEEVMWGNKVPDDEKVTRALQFVTQKGINKVKKSKLSAHSNVNSKGMSNILTNLDTIEEIAKKEI